MYGMTFCPTFGMYTFQSVMEDKENPTLPGTPLINTPVGSKDTPGTSKGTPIRPLTAAYLQGFILYWTEPGLYTIYTGLACLQRQIV
jgi:hypothetical protein